MLENPPKPIRIAIVGDVHDQWETADEIALHHLNVDLVLLVGDFGNESVELVARLATLDLPKAAIFGNHDAWYTASDWGRSKSPYDPLIEDRVQQQTDLLGVSYVGYGKLDFPDLNLSVVGSRPFSWGGPTWKYNDFYETRYGVDSFAASTQRIVEVAGTASCEHLIIIGHNGPTGLGAEPESICGKDWGESLGGDYGDPDLAEAIAILQSQGKSLPLVAFGHMHHKLRHTKERLRQPIVVRPDGIVYLNAARCPRIISTIERTLRNFSLVTMIDGKVTQAGLVWMTEDFEVGLEEVYWSNKAEISI
ncbi:TIGR04168 family protein [Chamaesiphon sp.]|uniref:TIGR04168 family protein n=1 Tax=Chamaesiphon sp. TaxID=2814140 RepID=UPI0035937249